MNKISSELRRIASEIQSSTKKSSQFFTDYKQAHNAAIDLARKTNHDVAIRKGKEYSRSGFYINLASRNDSDYDTAEIVRPSDTKTASISLPSDLRMIMESYDLTLKSDVIEKNGGEHVVYILSTTRDLHAGIRGETLATFTPPYQEKHEFNPGSYTVETSRVSNYVRSFDKDQQAQARKDIFGLTDKLHKFLSTAHKTAANSELPSNLKKLVDTYDLMVKSDLIEENGETRPFRILMTLHDPSVGIYGDTLATFTPHYKGLRGSYEIETTRIRNYINELDEDQRAEAHRDFDQLVHGLARFYGVF